MYSDIKPPVRPNPPEPPPYRTIMPNRKPKPRDTLGKVLMAIVLLPFVVFTAWAIYETFNSIAVEFGLLWAVLAFVWVGAMIVFAVRESDRS